MLETVDAEAITNLQREITMNSQPGYYAIQLATLPPFANTEAKKSALTSLLTRDTGRYTLDLTQKPLEAHGVQYQTEAPEIFALPARDELIDSHNSPDGHTITPEQRIIAPSLSQIPWLDTTELIKKWQEIDRNLRATTPAGASTQEQLAHVRLGERYPGPVPMLAFYSLSSLAQNEKAQPVATVPLDELIKIKEEQVQPETMTGPNTDEVMKHALMFGSDSVSDVLEGVDFYRTYFLQAGAMRGEDRTSKVDDMVTQTLTGISQYRMRMGQDPSVWGLDNLIKLARDRGMLLPPKQ